MKRALSHLLAIALLPQAVFASVLVGKTEGAFSVSPSGAATYTIPIKIQKGMSDFIPDISLSYNSQTGNGIAGLGWSISGLSSISIAPRCLYFDGQAEAIYRGEDNAYALDGMRLLLTSGANGQTGATYRTENEQYNIISITSSSNGTPATFLVKSTDGTKYKYGSSSGRYTLPGGEVYQWALDYAEDALGNYISYSYSQEGILYPTTITYGRNTRGTAGVDCMISFDYETRPDSIFSYMLGHQSFLKKRLKSIVCKYNGNTYKTYTLNYSEDTLSRLTSVTESGTSNSSLRPTTFEWSVPQFQVSCNSRSMDTWTLEDPDEEYFFSGDLDGDGISELISTYTFSVNSGAPLTLISGRKWNPANQKFEFCYDSETQSDIGMSGMYEIMRAGGLVMHVRHDKNNSVVLPFCRLFNYSKTFIFDFPKEGLDFSIPLKGITDVVPAYMIFDADRNGIDDMFIIEKELYNGKYPAYLTSCNLSTETFSYSEISLDLQGVPDRIRCADYNSDGMADLLVTTSNGYYIYWNRSGSFSDTDRYYGTTFNKCDIIETGDFNGDGLPDLIINKHNSTEWYIAQNTGNETDGYFALHAISALSQAGARNIIGKENKLYCIVQDIDGDGKSDAVVGYPHYYGDGGYICILKSDGSALAINSIYDLPDSGNYPNIAHIVQGNMDGHSGMEILYWGKGLGQNTTGWHLLKNPLTKASSQKITAITDGLGATDSIRYGLLTDNDVYSVTRQHSFPLIPLAGSFPVVASRTESIPSESRTTNYSYANGFLHLQGKGFIGFEDVRVESSTGIVTDTHSDLDSTFYVLPSGTVKQSTSGGILITRSSRNTNLQSLGSQSYTIDGTTNSVRKQVEGFGESETCSDFEYGFPTYQETEDDNFSVEKEITYWESPLDSVWIKGLPEEVDITKSGDWIVGDDVYEKVVYERAASTGLILKETKTRNGQTVSTDGYSYNEYGQMTLHYTVSFNSTDTLVSRYEYNSKGQLTTEYDARGLSRSYTYNSRYGTLASVLDFDGVRTQYTYDGLFRETKRSTPIESIQTTRTRSNYSGGAYYIKQSRTGETPVTTYYDAWERKIVESSPLADGTLIYQNYQYLPNGKVGFVSFPHKRTETNYGGTTYTYNDVAQRLTSTMDSNGKTSTWSYDYPCYVISTIDGITTMTDYYTPDKVHVVEDASGWIEYYYNADGNIETIYIDGFEADYEYDTYGRLIRTTDMNGVTKEYSYDNNGYPYRTSVAGNIVETNYDKYGILRSKSWFDSGETPHAVNYTYDNRFRLIREEGDGYRNTYSYDSYGRITQKSKRVTDNQPESLNVAFQYSGNQISRTSSYFNSLPSTTVIIENFSYQNGYNVSDTLNNTSVWQLARQDRWGNATEERVSQGILKHSYDDYGNMQSMRCQGSHPLISESYTYDVPTGNMSSKNSIPLTYDSMNRLTGWGSHSYSYDDAGNITHQPFVGDFSYSGYRVTGMTQDSVYCLDDSLCISYYKAIERPRSIENSHYKADFYYDGNGDRFMVKVYERHNEGDSLVFTRYYMDANAEVTLDTLGHYTHLFYAGGDAYTAPAVMVFDEVGNTEMYQIARDNLGSVIRYANANGVRYQYSYSPWGVRTHQVGDSTVFYQPGEESSFGPFYRTYTGHEDLWMFGLLNANARLYSPYLGRFISPDPLLNEDGTPLDFNPYVYARNNPYRYIDRNGEFIWTIAAAAIFSGGFNVMMNFNNINGTGDFFKFFGVGAIAGAAGAAGALGFATAFLAPAAIGGFAGGAMTGAIGGSISGFVLGGGNALISGGDFWKSALMGALIGTASGAIVGGVSGGIYAKTHKGDFWTGKPQTTPTCHRPAMTEPDAMPSQSGVPEKTQTAQSSKPLQRHHFATNKNTKYTPKMENVVKKYDLDLNGEWNIEKLPHQGRHPNVYHDFILEQMREIDMMPNMNKMEFINQFEQRVKVPIRNNPDMLYKKYWQQKMR